MNNKGADQTARMRRLICAFVVRKGQKQVFSWRGSNDKPAQSIKWIEPRHEKTRLLDFDYVILKPACTATQTSEIYERTSMLKALVFPNYKYMIRIIWFCIVLTANTCSLHENQHYHMWSSMVYIKQAMASTLLWPLVLLLSHLILLKLFPYLRYLTLTFISDMMQIFENVKVTLTPF